MNKENNSKPITMIWIILAIILTASITFGAVNYACGKQNDIINIKVSALETEKSEMSDNLERLQTAYSKTEVFISTLKQYDLYKIRYRADVDVVQKRMDRINGTLDYTSCKAEVDASREMHRMFNSDEQITREYLKTIAETLNNSYCSAQISEYSGAQTVVIDARKIYDDSFENWCYGFHKVDWSVSWLEEYSAPWSRASDKLSEAEDKIGSIYSKAIETCFSI